MNELKANIIFDNMSLKDCIDMWNDSAVDHYYRSYAIHSTEDDEWWEWLFNEYSAFDLVTEISYNSSDTFCIHDQYFFYDKETAKFYSFNTKRELIDILGEEFFIDNIVNSYM